MASEWYHQASGEETGPVPFATLVQLVRDETLDESSLVRRSDSQEWQRADSVVGLYYMARRQTAKASETEVEQDESVSTEIPRPGWWGRLLDRLLGRTSPFPADPISASMDAEVVTAGSESSVSHADLPSSIAVGSPDQEVPQRVAGGSGIDSALPSVVAEAEATDDAANREWLETVKASLGKVDRRKTLHRGCPNRKPARMRERPSFMAGVWAFLSTVFRLPFSRKPKTGPVATTSVPAKIHSVGPAVSEKSESAKASLSTADSQDLETLLPIGEINAFQQAMGPQSQEVLSRSEQTDVARPVTAADDGDDVATNAPAGKEWSATVDAALQNVDTRLRRQTRQEESESRQAWLSTLVAAPFYWLLAVPRFSVQFLQRVVDAVFNLRVIGGFTDWLAKKGVQPSGKAAWLIRHGIRIVPAIVCANAVLIGVTRWAEREAMRFPAGNQKAIEYRLPLVGTCDESEYWFLLIDAMLVAAGIAYAIGYYLERDADDA